MRRWTTILWIVVIALFLVRAARAQDYLLDWQHATQPARHQTEASSKEFMGSVAPDPWKKPETADPQTVRIIARQSYDHYNNRYRKVRRVESLVYRGGYPEDVVHCNRARYDWYDIYLEDLEPGDRYKVRVTWDDGSHRTVEHTMGPWSQSEIVIWEPLAFDARFES